MIFLGLGLSFTFRDLDLNYYVDLSLFVVLTCNEGYGLNNMYGHTYVLYNSLYIFLFTHGIGR